MNSDNAIETWDRLYEQALSLVKIADLEIRLKRIQSEFLGHLYLGYKHLMSNNYFIGVKNETWARDPGSKSDVAYEASDKRCYLLLRTELLSRRSFAYVPAEKRTVGDQNEPKVVKYPKTNIITGGVDMEKRGDADCKNHIDKYIKRKRNSEECKDVHIVENNDGSGIDRELIEEALLMIDPRHSQAIRLKYYDGKSQLEIAEIMGIGAATISDWIGEKGRKIAFKELQKAFAKILENRKDTNQ